MTRAAFYNLQTDSVERVLPLLLEKSLKEGMKVLLRAPSEERLRDWDALLWTYRQESFIPHGAAEDGNAERQPVCLTTEPENPNGAALLALAGGAEPFDVSDFARAIYLYDGGDEESCRLAERHQAIFRDAGAEIVVWRQTPDGWREETAP